MRSIFLDHAFGYAFRCWREKSQLTKLEAAVYLNCSLSYINQLESCKVDNGKIDLILSVCDAMERPITDFIKEIE